MYVNAKRMAFLGLLLACTVILIILSSVLEFNTLFLLAGASFGVGIAIREHGLRLGFGFFLASILLGVMLSPNKLYCITYGAMAFYIVILEFSWRKLTLINNNRKRIALLWVIKYCSFNVMFLPIIFFLPNLIYAGVISIWVRIGIVIAGQIFLLFYDRAYDYFHKMIWGKYRKYFI